MYIDPKYIIGKDFYPANDPSIPYECIGYGDGGTMLVVGMYFDSVNNRTQFKTFKLTDVKFLGKLTIT